MKEWLTLLADLLRWLLGYSKRAQDAQQQAVQEAEQRGRADAEAEALQRTYEQIAQEPVKHDQELIDGLNKEFQPPIASTSPPAPPWPKLAEAARTSPPPVDWSQRTLADGSSITPDHKEIDPRTGQQKGYVVLSEVERLRGFVRPVRRSYKHLTCGSTTTMGTAIAETYAREPTFYSGTFCVACRAHFPVGPDGEFVWAGTDEKVGT